LLGLCDRGAVEPCTYLVVMACNRAILLLIALCHPWPSTLLSVPALFVEELHCNMGFSKDYHSQEKYFNMMGSLLTIPF
jgi:hypothetical protein